jgi:hypothetical protein
MPVPHNRVDLRQVPPAQQLAAVLLFTPRGGPIP